MTDYAQLAEAELERADVWANKDGSIEADFRQRMVDHALRRADIYAHLAIAQEIKLLTDTHAVAHDLTLDRWDRR